MSLVNVTEVSQNSTYFSVASYNLHKGFSPFNTRLALAEQRDLLRHLAPDLILLQEVQGDHRLHASRHAHWPLQGPLAFLAERDWPYSAYGLNARYEHGHHGNAILSKYPLTQVNTMDISMHTLEQRGLLHAVVDVRGQSVHIINLHLGLLARWRRAQLGHVEKYIHANIPDHAPLMIGGDFNDWSGRAGASFAKALGLDEVFKHHTGAMARSFPAWMPVLKLDRIYVRGLQILHAERPPAFGKALASDHVILLTHLAC